MMGSRLAEDVYDTRQRRIDTGAHVHRLDREPGCVNADHFKTSRNQSAHSCIAERGHCTVSLIEPRRTSIRIGASSAAGCAGNGSATKLSLEVAATGFTGTSELDCARSASMTHRLSRLALIDRSSAHAAIDASGL
jgi:hypothetical protein